MGPATVRRRSAGIWRWGLGGLGTLGLGLASCSLVCSVLVPGLLALGVGASAVAGLGAGAGLGGKLLAAVGTFAILLAAARWWLTRRNCVGRGASKDGSHPEPIACTLERDGMRRRLEEFRQVFERAFLVGEHLVDGVRWRFRAEPGLEAELRALADKERQCCRFFRFEIHSTGDEVWWSTRADNPAASPVLEDFLMLPIRLMESEREAREPPASSA